MGLHYHVAGVPSICVNNGDNTYSWQPLTGASAAQQAAIARVDPGLASTRDAGYGFGWTSAGIPHSRRDMINLFDITGSAPGADVDNTTALLAAITKAQGYGGGTILIPTDIGISAQVIVPQGVNIWGAGAGKGTDIATTIKCLAVAAQLQFGSFATAARGGVSGNFEVNGNNLAPTPLAAVKATSRTFQQIDVHNAASGGLGAFWVYHTNNAVFSEISTSDNHGSGFVFDTSANGNIVVGLNSRGNGITDA
ncbi:MAG: hypothetical protein M3Q75_00785, partial [Gemmatimonadota bacterium]|nr:hypothetical protein [Gemmatimonadota bacterium]